MNNRTPLPAQPGVMDAVAVLRTIMTGERTPRVLAAAALLVATAAQVRVWATGRGFWFDELAVAVNLPTRTVPQLAGHLDYNQVAPFGWLAMEKVLFELLGPDERVLRLPSLLAGILVLLLTAVIAYRLTGWWGVAVAVGLAGLSVSMLYYSGELKQYAVEAAVALGLLALGDELVRRSGSGWRPRWWVLAAGALAAAMAVALSYTGLIVLAGVTAGLGAHLAGRRRWRALAALLLAAAPAALVGGGLAWFRLSLPLARGQDVVFATGMPARGSGPADVLVWLPRMWSGFVADPLRWHGPVWTLLLVLGGLVALVVRGRARWAAMFAGVLVAAVGAAAVRGYPLAERVALYLVAPVILLAVAGGDGLIRGLTRMLRGRRLRAPAPVAVALAALALAGVALGAGPDLRAGLHEIVYPRNSDLSREALADVARRLRPGDAVLVYNYTDRVTRWYGEWAGVTPVGRVALVPTERCERERLDRLLAGAARIWYLHGKRLSRDPADYTERVTRELAGRGEVVATRTFRHRTSANVVGWVLVDLAAGPDPDPPPVPPDPAHACLSGSPANRPLPLSGGGPLTGNPARR
jgi:hypothetical protein